MYAKLENDAIAIYPYDLGQLQRDNPNVSFAFPISVETLAAHGIVEVQAVPTPATTATQAVAEGLPEFVDGSWRQVWITTPVVPSVVSRAQARKALALAGLFDLVQPAIDAIVDPLQRRLVQIDWDDSQVFERGNPTLAMLAAALGLTDAQLDDLFTTAATL